MLLESEAEIRRRISRRYQRRLLFFIHLALTLPVGIMIDSFDRFGFLWRFHNIFLAMWFAALFIHGIILFTNSAKEHAIQREIERQQHIAAGFDLKPKRSSRLSIGEDGELLDLAEDLRSRDSSR